MIGIRYKVLPLVTSDSPQELEERLEVVGLLGWDFCAIVSLARGPAAIFKRSEATEQIIVDAFLNDAADRSTTAAE